MTQTNSSSYTNQLNLVSTYKWQSSICLNLRSFTEKKEKTTLLEIYEENSSLGQFCNK